MITQARLKELFKYENGKLIRIVNVQRGRIGDVVGSLAYGYLQVMIDFKQYRVHRLIWLYHTGEYPDMLDHINGVKTDNRIENLRKCTASQNSMNTTIQNNHSVGVKGITYCAKTKRYRTSIKADGIRYRESFSISKYKSKELALQNAIAWLDNLRPKLHKEFANAG